MQKGTRKFLHKICCRNNRDIWKCNSCFLRFSIRDHFRWSTMIPSSIKNNLWGSHFSVQWWWSGIFMIYYNFTLSSLRVKITYLTKIQIEHFWYFDIDILIIVVMDVKASNSKLSFLVYWMIFFITATCKVCLLFCIRKKIHINSIQDGLFWGCWKASFPKICHTYLTKMQLGTVIFYLNKVQKLYESGDACFKYCWHQHFFNGNQHILLYQEIQI